MVTYKFGKLSHKSVSLFGLIEVSYLVQSTFFGVVKNSKRRAHCTAIRGVEKDMGPSMGMEKRKLV